MCRGFWVTTHAIARADQYSGVHENRKGVARKPNFRWASKGKEPIIKPNFENRVNVGMKSDMGVKIKDTNGNKSCHSNTTHPTVNVRVGLKIQLELVYGPGVKWDVAWAHVTDTEAHSQAQDKPSPR
ncbi:hypothetical protein FCV25MIE_14687 [Fagus crenata]